MIRHHLKAFFPHQTTHRLTLTALEDVTLNTAHTIWKECAAGLTTFIMMAYALIVNPLILAHAGLPLHTVFLATCITSAIACLLMGLWVRLPIMIAPSMAINSYFVAHLVPFYQGQWRQALTAVMLSGFILMLIAYLKWPRHIIKALPESLMLGTMSGIGLFMMWVALDASGIGYPWHHWPVNPQAIFNFSLTCLLIQLGQHYRIPGHFLISLVLVTLAANLGFKTHVPSSVVDLTQVTTTLNQIDFRWGFRTLVHALVLAGLIVFDSTSTLHTLTENTPLKTTSAFAQQQRLTLMTTGFTTLLGAHLGTSNMGIYFESASGISAGGRTGWSALLVGACFLASLLLGPYLSYIPNSVPTAALFMIAFSIAKRGVKLKNMPFCQAAPACLVLISIPAFHAIADGLGLGVLTYLALNAKKTAMNTWILGAVFVIYFLVRLIYLGG
ncbi:MAG: hypothetical protein CMF51_03460 [Legionellales bacterium]|nr:hypothetical protein [Legionellales bacterium]